MTIPVSVVGMSAAAALAEPPQPNDDCCYGAQCRPVPLDVPDVTLRGLRLLAYGERLCLEEDGTAAPEPGQDCPAARPRHPLLGRQIPEVVEQQPPVLPMPGQAEDVREIVHLRLPQAEARTYREPTGIPEIGRSPLDLGVPCHPPCCGPTPPATSLPRTWIYYFMMNPGSRMLHRLGSPVQHCLAKLDTFKGENRERLDDFVYQVEEFAAFHAWDPVEPCRQARTHLSGVALAYNRCAPLLPRNWQELKDLLTERFQPRDLMASYKVQFRLSMARIYTPTWRPCRNWLRWHGLYWTP